MDSFLLLIFFDSPYSLATRAVDALSVYSPWKPKKPTGIVLQVVSTEDWNGALKWGVYLDNLGYEFLVLSFDVERVGEIREVIAYVQKNYSIPIELLIVGTHGNAHTLVFESLVTAMNIHRLRPAFELLPLSARIILLGCQTAGKSYGLNIAESTAAIADGRQVFGLNVLSASLGWQFDPITLQPETAFRKHLTFALYVLGLIDLLPPSKHIGEIRCYQLQTSGYVAQCGDGE